MLSLLLNNLKNFAAPCNPGGDFFGLPTWYKYLDGQLVQNTILTNSPDKCQPIVASVADVWLILAAIIDLLLRLAIIFAIAFIVIGGFKYTTSQGQPEETSKAKNTIINALIGLVIAITGATIINFIAGRF